MRLIEFYKKWKIRKLLVMYDKNFDNHAFNRSKCVDILNLLDVDRLNKYDPSIGAAISITSRYWDIYTYIKKINTTIVMLRREKIIPINWDDVVERNLTLDRFFILDGYYCDVKKSVLEFKTCSLELCELLENSDGAEYGVNEHNRRMLTKIVNNICLIAIKLVTITVV